MNEKRYIPGTRPEWGRELRDDEDNGLIDKYGDNWDNGYNFEESKDPEDAEDDIPEFNPEAAKRAREEESSKTPQSEMPKEPAEDSEAEKAA